MERVIKAFGVWIAASICCTLSIGCTNQRAHHLPLDSGADFRPHVPDYFLEERYVEVRGLVAKPGFHEWREGITLGEVLKSAGGAAIDKGAVKLRREERTVLHRFSGRLSDSLLSMTLSRKERIEVVTVASEAKKMP